MAELRISDLAPGPDGRRRVELTWRDGALPRQAVTEFADEPGQGDGERIRWYLEDYAEFPADPAPAIARAAEQRLAQAGEDLFIRVFSGTDAAGIWDRARDRLGDVRVEVNAGAGPGLAWELLRDPARDAPVALGARGVRPHPLAGGRAPGPAGACRGPVAGAVRDLPTPAAGTMCRSGRWPARLVRGGAAQMEGLDLDVLRRATFARLSEALHAACTTRAARITWSTSTATAPMSTWPTLSRVSTSSHMYGFTLAAPARAGQHGYLVFEDPDREENQQLADGPSLGKLLTRTGVPVLVLNACRSAYAEARAEPGEASGDMHARIRAYGSLAAEIADEGVPGVVAMRYNIYVGLADPGPGRRGSGYSTGKPL